MRIWSQRGARGTNKGGAGKEMKVKEFPLGNVVNRMKQV